MIGALIVLPIGFIMILNYRDDYYAVTNRRVTRRDRQLFIYEARVESPIEAVQDVTTKISFWAAVFDFGDVTVRTADKATTIIFAHVPEPDQVQKLIAETKAEALTAQRGLRAETLRRGLMSGLDLSLMIPERMRALGSDAPSPGRRAGSNACCPSADERSPQCASAQPKARQAGLVMSLARDCRHAGEKLSSWSRPEPKPLPAETTISGASIG